MRELGSPLQLKQNSFERLRAELAAQSAIVSFKSDGKFCSFLACVGMQFELQHEEWDRLSAPLGVEKGTLQSQMIVKDDCFGVVLTKKDGDEFYPDHPGFKDLIDPSSLDENRRLSRIVFFPEKVANNLRTKGIELVIVRDWVLDSFLAKRVTYNYQFASESEMDSKSALWQAQLVSQQQLSFSGTHDLADHLLSANHDKLSQSSEIFLKCWHYIETYEDQKLLTYTMGVLLDDLAQPKWYNSRKHIDSLHELFQRFEKHDQDFNFKSFIDLARS